MNDDIRFAARRLARRPDVVLACIGWGMLAALSMTRMLTALLHTVSPTDAPSSVFATVAFLVVAAVASFFSAVKAGWVDPLVALRAD